MPAGINSVEAEAPPASWWQRRRRDRRRARRRSHSWWCWPAARELTPSAAVTATRRTYAGWLRQFGRLQRDGPIMTKAWIEEALAAGLPADALELHLGESPTGGKMRCLRP